jgi:putative tryptophan/tyrosine transport system substrate-binding protein
MKMHAKNKWKTVVAAAMAVLALGLAGCGGSSSSKAEQGTKQYKVGIVQLVEHSALDAANKGFVDGLAKKGFQEGKNITYDRQNAQADQSNLQNIAQRFVNNKVDLICAIATPAAQTVANATKDIPIVGTAITDYKLAKLVRDPAKPGTNVTGTTDMNPIKEQVAMLHEVFPQAKRVGVIYSSSEVNSQTQVDILKKEAAAVGLTVVEATVSNVNDIQQAARSLIGKVDVFYIPTDNVMASAMPTLTKVTNEAKLAVVCAEPGEVKAGGLLTLGIDYYQLGIQTGEMAADILNGKSKPQDMAIQSQKKFKVVINQKEADLLGVQIPDKFRKDAEILK